MTKIRLQDIDWAALWQQANDRKALPKKNSADWDQKAKSFATRTVHSVYTEKFLELLSPEADWSVLDIGCGPGTLAIPIARRSRKVTALDFSAKMLEILKSRAEKMKLHNITCHRLAWEDDWNRHGIKPHDVAIASRSMAVTDLKHALIRLNNFATKLVCITDRVKHGPKDPEAFAAIGRTKQNAPDYIYTVNLLYQLGILPTVNYITLEEKLEYSSFSEALASYTWMFRSLTTNEEKKLAEYIQSISSIAADGSVTVHRRHIPTWAYISWKPITIAETHH